MEYKLTSMAILKYASRLNLGWSKSIKNNSFKLTHSTAQIMEDRYKIPVRYALYQLRGQNISPKPRFHDDQR
ncbi:BgTH12-02314 [Blumeria graminis f. sp. triticale]|uniref:Bgt-20549 n=3 Tax=Blumeria graminis TaxID=34373 RepID=A0A381L460_BLUGR|nr:BgTH12-02314 [Blumeria graminis f. sp. triticale]VDB86044.1 Bgt-20549 [Blumeria graminis f. sp. tritici]